MRFIVWASIAVGCFGCARGPNVSSQLPLKRVVVYRNGVGYFERAGKVDEERVTFEMRQRLVGDFLASLAVIERGGSSVRSASFPLELEDKESPKPEEPQPIPLLVEDGDGRVRAPTPPPPNPPPKKPDPNAMREVVLHLDGKEHDLSIGYLSETPVWRPSYRVVIGSDNSADLQAWGIVQNLSGEDWNDISLSLVAGAPLAFQSTLGTPVLPQRPVVTDEGEVVAEMPTGVTSLDRSGKDEDVSMAESTPTAGHVAREEGAREVRKVETSELNIVEDEASGSYGYAGGASAVARSKKADMRRAAQPRPSAPAAAPKPAPAPPPPPGLSPPRRVSDLAAVALEAGTTRYDIPYPVTVPKQSATMVLLQSQRVPGAAVLLFSPEAGVSASGAHPFRVARFTNSTKGLLERGPIAVFERGSFLGQGVLEPLPARATATVPFAIERSVAITQDSRQDQTGSRLFRIEAGRLWIERDFSSRRIYRIDNGGDTAVKLLVKHARIPGTRLFKPPAGTEDNAGTGAALVPIDLRPHSKSELSVDERRPNQEETDWLSNLADDAVKGYVADARANPEIVKRLRDAWTLRDSLRRTTDEFEKLSNERNELERVSDETRRNLRAIEKNPQAADLRQKLTKRLGDASSRIDAITKRTIELQMSIDEQQVRFRDAVRDLKLDGPLPVKD
ncbi:MAG: hypothetical protein ACOY0T_19085 [Myxococcota bacterium]